MIELPTGEEKKATDRPEWTPASAAQWVAKLRVLPSFEAAPCVTTDWVRRAALIASERGLNARAVEAALRCMTGQAALPEVHTWLVQWLAANAQALIAPDGPTIPTAEDQPPAGQYQPIRIACVEVDTDPKQASRKYIVRFTIVGGRFYGRSYSVRMGWPSEKLDRLVYHAGIGRRQLKIDSFWPQALAGLQLWSRLLVQDDRVTFGDQDADARQIDENKRLWRERTTGLCPFDAARRCVQCRVKYETCGLANDEPAAQQVTVGGACCTAISPRLSRKKGTPQ